MAVGSVTIVTTMLCLTLLALTLAFAAGKFSFITVYSDPPRYTLR